MADNKKYYYLKLKEDFYDREEIKIIEAMPNGHLYTNILLKLYLRSLKREGRLMVTDYIPYSPETLAAVLGHNIDTIRGALTVFQQFKLIEILDNGAIYLLEIQNFIGRSTTEADRKRAQRNQIEEERNKLLGSGQMSDKCPKLKEKERKNQGCSDFPGQMSDKCIPEIEIEIEIETEIEQQQEIRRLTKCTKKESINIYKAVVDNYPQKDVVVVVKEKLEIITNGNFKNPIGALIKAIKDNWQISKETFSGKSNINFNNFEARDKDYDALEKKLLGWEE